MSGAKRMEAWVPGQDAGGGPLGETEKWVSRPWRAPQRGEGRGKQGTADEPGVRDRLLRAQPRWGACGALLHLCPGAGAPVGMYAEGGSGAQMSRTQAPFQMTLNCQGGIAGVTSPNGGLRNRPLLRLPGPRCPRNRTSTSDQGPFDGYGLGCWCGSSDPTRPSGYVVQPPEDEAPEPPAKPIVPPPRGS
jgi:hypothetical protein